MDLFIYKEKHLNIESGMEKLPSPDELPSCISADQTADIDKLFDSLAPDYSALAAMYIQ